MNPTYCDDVDCHLSFLYYLLKERPKAASISHWKMPTLLEHCTFVLSKPYAEWFIIKLKSIPIGAIYLSKQGEIGVSVKQQFQGMGFEAKAVRWMISRHPKDRLLANVNPKNKHGMKLWKNLGWKVIQETFCNE